MRVSRKINSFLSHDSNALEGTHRCYLEDDYGP